MELVVQVGRTPGYAKTPHLLETAKSTYGALGFARALHETPALENIRNTRRIFGVMQAGHLYSRQDLDALLRGVREAAQ